MNLEANRCLLCKKPKCSEIGCPVHTSIPECMVLYKEGKLLEAGERLFQNNPLSAITSVVCDWSRFCYGNCVRNAKNEAVRWYEIEQEISQAFLKQFHGKKEITNGKKIAVIGGGPAGIASAYFLQTKGYEVTLYDKHAQMGGVLRYGIPPFRLDRSLINELERILLETGITFKGNTIIGKDITIEELRKQNDVVIISTGTERSHQLGIPGEGNENVYAAIEYLNEPKAYTLGKKVIVIGGGNVAMDASRTAIRQGCDTSIYYRKAYENMPANKKEVAEAQEEGVTIHFFEAPVEIKEHAITFIRCENAVEKVNGRVMTHFIEGSEHDVPCDSVIIATGEMQDYSIFQDNLPFCDAYRNPEVNEYGQTSFENVFITGDFLLGPTTVVQAIQAAKKTVEGVNYYLTNGIPTSALEENRKRINQIDAKLVTLFEERMKAVEKIAQYKKENQMPLLDQKREEENIKQNVARVTHKELDTYFIDFYQHLMDVSKQYQKDLSKKKGK